MSPFTVNKSQVSVNLRKSDPHVFQTVSFYILILKKERWGDASGFVLEEKTLNWSVSTFWVGWKYLEWPNPAVSNISQPTSMTCMHQWLSLLSQPYRKCLDVSDLLPAPLAVRSSAVTPPPSPRPLTLLPNVTGLRRTLKADSMKTPHTMKALTQILIGRGVQLLRCSGAK